MNTAGHFCLFDVAGQRYGLDVSSIVQVVRAVEVTPLPNAPQQVLGVINLRGQIIPVITLSPSLGLTAGDVKLSDHFIICSTTKRVLALIVDSVLGVIKHPAQRFSGEQRKLADGTYINGVVKLKDGLVLIYDVEKFLSSEEEQILKNAMQQPAST